MEKIYKISGMHCAACAVGIEKFLGAQEGVSSAAVNLATERMTVIFDENKISSEGVIAKTALLGFGAEDYIPPEQRGAEERATEAAAKKKEQRQRNARLIACVALALPMFYICVCHMSGHALPLPGFMSPTAHPGMYGLVQLLLTTGVLILGRRFFTAGLPALLHRQPTMDSLVALGTGSAYLYSLYALIQIWCGRADYTDSLFFDSAATVVTLVMLGKTLEAASRERTGDAIRALRALVPETALVTRYGVSAEIPSEELRTGDIVTVAPGSRFPCDGIVTEGESTADLSMLTGESVPVPLAPGGEVTGGSVNGEGRVVLTVSGTGGDSRLAGIIRLVEEAQGRKAPIAALADKIAGVFVPAVLAIALLSALAWALGGKSAEFVLNIFVSVLVVACPCSLGLATPTAILCGTGRAAELGILFRSGEALQKLASVDCAALDKTGTVTRGELSVTEISAEDGREEELLTLAAAAETGSSHPAAAAVRREAEARGLTLPESKNARALPGKGVFAEINGRAVYVGNEVLMEEQGISFARDENKTTALYIAVDGKYAGRIAARDRIREDSAAAIARLQTLGLRCVMLTGDNAGAAESVAAEAGVDEVIANILPGEKSARIEALRAEGRRVCMLGDGINDAPALAAADVGLAMGSGTDIAMESADVVLTGSSLHAAADAVELSRAVLRNIKQNLFWAFIYNICGIPFAAGLVYLLGGPLLNPMFCGAAMALSSVCVVSNALRLRRWNRQNSQK